MTGIPKCKELPITRFIHFYDLSILRPCHSTDQQLTRASNVSIIYMFRILPMVPLPTYNIYRPTTILNRWEKITRSIKYSMFMLYKPTDLRCRASLVTLLVVCPKPCTINGQFVHIVSWIVCVHQYCSE